MAFSVKPSKPPAFDDVAFADRLYQRVKQTFGHVQLESGRVPVENESQPYVVFDARNDEGERIGFPRFVHWVRALRDVVNANALGLDALKLDVDKHESADDIRHKTINDRLAALEAQQTVVPFPGRG
jgi:hypothetical protein